MCVEPGRKAAPGHVVVDAGGADVPTADGSGGNGGGGDSGGGGGGGVLIKCARAFVITCARVQGRPQKFITRVGCASSQ